MLFMDGGVIVEEGHPDQVISAAGGTDPDLLQRVLDPTHVDPGAADLARARRG